jgi:hypothetical protein
MGSIKHDSAGPEEVRTSDFGIDSYVLKNTFDFVHQLAPEILYPLLVVNSFTPKLIAGRRVEP